MVSPQYQSLIEKDFSYIWHPFTQMQDYMLTDPLIVERGEGVMLYDVDGRAYYDSVASIWTNTLGHHHPALTDAIIRQAQKVAHSTLLGHANVPSILLAERLIQISPEGLRKVFYCDSGAEAVEIALKMAFQYWQHKGRPKKKAFVKFVEAYHGDTIGAVSVGAVDMFHAVYRDLLFPTLEVMYPYCYRCPLNKELSTCQHACLEPLRDLLAQRSDDIAALIVEPIQGSSGIITMPQGYLTQLRELCTEYDVLMIVDEVATGFGRTGQMFACDHEGVSPDLMTIGKGLTGGYLPVAATLTSDEVYEAFLAPYEDRKTFFHGHTFTGNQLGCAVAIENLNQFESLDIIEHVREMAEVARVVLARFNDLEHVGEIRQKGLFIGIELVKDKQTKEAYDWNDRIGVKVGERARELGMINRTLGPIALFIPPLIVNQQEILAMLDILYESIKWATNGETV